jgi:hypothetical protein
MHESIYFRFFPDISVDTYMPIPVSSLTVEEKWIRKMRLGFKKKHKQESPMKKTLLVVAGVLIASVIAASAQEVLSANAVGYIKKTIPADGGLVPLSIPLNSMTETDIVFGRTSVAAEAPQGATVFFWTGLNWDGGTKGSRGWAAAQSNRVIAVGEAFFLKGAAGDVAREVTITGEVPDDTTLSKAVTGGGNLNPLANPYPVDFKFGESTLAANAAQNSTVFFWTGANWDGGSKGSRGWAAAQSNRVVQAGEGFFLQEVGASGAWVASKPYTWP